MPLGLKIAPVLLVGGLAAALLGGGGSSGPDGPTESNSLPAPPIPGN